jgi:hypothetical protein
MCAPAPAPALCWATLSCLTVADGAALPCSAGTHGSRRTPTAFYSVHLWAGVCTCPAASTGAVYKHGLLARLHHLSMGQPALWLDAELKLYVDVKALVASGMASDGMASSAAHTAPPRLVRAAACLPQPQRRQWALQALSRLQYQRACLSPAVWAREPAAAEAMEHVCAGKLNWKACWGSWRSLGPTWRPTTMGEEGSRRASSIRRGCSLNGPAWAAT